MITRYNRKWSAPEVKACPIKSDFELVTRIKPVSFNEDKSVKEYTEENIWTENKSKWSDFIKSYDLGSPSDQVLSHLEKGTPLVTAHTLPYGDYTSQNLLKGAEIVREMREKGITLDMITEALKEPVKDASIEEVKEGGAE